MWCPGISLHMILKLSLVHLEFTSSTSMAFLWHSKMLHLPWCLRHIQDSGLTWLPWSLLGYSIWHLLKPFIIKSSGTSSLQKEYTKVTSLTQVFKDGLPPLKLSPYKYGPRTTPRQEWNNQKFARVAYLLSHDFHILIWCFWRKIIRVTSYTVNIVLSIRHVVCHSGCRWVNQLYTHMDTDNCITIHHKGTSYFVHSFKRNDKLLFIVITAYI